MRSWPDVPPSSATRRNAANDGARNVDFECFLGSSGTKLLHTVPLQCHPKQCADKHLRPPTARSDTVAFILPPIPGSQARQTLVGALILAVAISGVMDRGRKSNRGNIDANDQPDPGVSFALGTTSSI